MCRASGSPEADWDWGAIGKNLSLNQGLKDPLKIEQEGISMKN